MIKESLSTSFLLTLSLLKKVILSQIIFLGLMSIFRFIFFLQFSGEQEFIVSEILSAFWLGIRLDAVVLGYAQAPITIVLIILWALRIERLFFKIQKYLIAYLTLIYLVYSVLIAIDFGYFSFFNEHITLMIYGILDDDTAALWQTMQGNYNIYLISASVLIYSAFIFFITRKVLKGAISASPKKIFFISQISFLIALVFINIMIIRGSFGMFPLSKIIPDVSQNAFVNEISNNGVLSFIKATKLYNKSKSGEYDLIKSTNYSGRINEAFSYLSEKDVQIDSDYIKAITYTVPADKNIEALQPHVVVVMVESFGLPIADYQSKEFNILGRLKKHFDEDTLFTNFISASNGTIVSLEPLLLNITARPNSTSIGQSKFQYTSFSQSAAKVYQKAGYETRFVYGGDLKWRNIGKFISLQGFDFQDGNIKISNALNINLKESSHDWGLFDQYSYDYVLKILKEAKKPQFIFLLTTNNHPPFTIPKDYVSEPLECCDDLKQCMIGDKELINKRLRDYQYAVDMAGRFMDEIKSSSLSKNSVVAITADNNTIEGRIRYIDPTTTSKKIPFYLYVPKSIKKDNIDTKVAGSHKDLFPTIYNQTLSNIEYIAVGKNLLDKSKRHCGFNDAGIIVSNNGAFKQNQAVSDIQKECDQEYKASLAVSDWLIQVNSKKQ